VHHSFPRSYVKSEIRGEVCLTTFSDPDFRPLQFGSFFKIQLTVMLRGDVRGFGDSGGWRFSVQSGVRAVELVGVALAVRDIGRSGHSNRMSGRKFGLSMHVSLGDDGWLCVDPPSSSQILKRRTTS